MPRPVISPTEWFYRIAAVIGISALFTLSAKLILVASAQ